MFTALKQHILQHFRIGVFHHFGVDHHAAAVLVAGHGHFDRAAADRSGHRLFRQLGLNGSICSCIIFNCCIMPPPAPPPERPPGGRLNPLAIVLSPFIAHLRPIRDVCKYSEVALLCMRACHALILPLSPFWFSAHRALFLFFVHDLPA
jgi:hypothetical protein